MLVLVLVLVLVLLVLVLRGVNNLAFPRRGPNPSTTPTTPDRTGKVRATALHAPAEGSV